MLQRFLLPFTFAVASACAAESTEFTTTESGLKYSILSRGTGPRPQKDQVLFAHYRGLLDDGTVFDESRERGTPFVFTLGRGHVIKGWDEGFGLLRVGDRAILIVPPELAYGDRSRGKIPANATLRFEVELLALKERALSDVLRDAMEKDGVGAARTLFDRLETEGLANYHVSEVQINAQGYRYLRANKTAEALALFQINTLLFPNSGNVHDSLGEAFWKSGQREAALNCYRRALELDPNNVNARKMLADFASQPGR